MKQQQAQAQTNSDKYLRKYKMEKDPAQKKKYAKLTASEKWCTASTASQRLRRQLSSRTRS